MGGDFNDVLIANDKLGGNPINRRRVAKLWNKINYCKLMDLGFKGSKYTWSNHNKISSNHIMERLDKFLANDAWVKMFPKASIIHLPKTHSDHNPILLELIPKRSNPLSKPFRLESYWCGHPEFGNIVKECWLDSNFVAASSIFKNRIIDWKNITFGDLFRKKKKKIWLD